MNCPCLYLPAKRLRSFTYAVLLKHLRSFHIFTNRASRHIQQIASWKVFSRIVFPERSDSEGVLLMLQKEECAEQVDSICEVIKEWLGGRECRVWASRTLAADLNLPMRTRPQADAIQLLLLAPGCPFVLLTVFNDTKTSSADVSTYAAQMSRLLTSSLHKFCSEDFGLLSCSIAHTDFTLEKLEEEIEHRKSILRKFYGGPILVSSTCCSAVTEAVVLLASVTSVPYLLHEHDRNPGHNEV